MSVYSKGRVDNGILTAKLTSFSELFEFSQYFHQSPSQYYFRGQSNEHWKLTTTLERFEDSLVKNVNGAGGFLLREFRRLIRGKGVISQLNIESEDELLCLGQHYGLPTPLLDWTESFFIAIFFAFADEISSDVENVAIWAIQSSATEIMKKYNDDEPNETLHLKFVDPLTDVNHRLVSQTGVFLQKPNGVFIEDLVEVHCKGVSNLPIMAKITIPASERESIINNLFAMNINWSTIYPGVEGAARHAKMKIEMLNLKVKKMGPFGLLEHTHRDIFGSPGDKS